MYVDKNLNHKVIEFMTTVVDNLLESIRIKICIEKNKNILISWINRAPWSSIKSFRDWIKEMVSEISGKVHFICWDLNIDLLNPNKPK